MYNYYYIKHLNISSKDLKSSISHYLFYHINLDLLES